MDCGRTHLNSNLGLAKSLPYDLEQVICPLSFTSLFGGITTEAQRSRTILMEASFHSTLQITPSTVTEDLTHLLQQRWRGNP